MSGAARARRRRGSSDAAMPLVEHLRELRRRLLVSVVFILIGSVVAWIFYDPLFAVLRQPFDRIVESAQAQGRDVQLVLAGVADPFTLQLQVSVVAGVILTTPLWLFQLWRFLMPGLHKRERRWAYVFAVSATPLFLLGAAVAWWALPTGLEILFGFTPEGVANFVQVNRYISFLLRIVLVFGIGFLLPFVVVMLNFAGVLSGAKVLSWWRYLIVGVFVFSAIATPTGDPVNLLLLAGPMTILMAGAIGISVANDKRRARRGLRREDWSAIGDDEISPL
jgi:sec-independent protein translocase protein TatC